MTLQYRANNGRTLRPPIRSNFLSSVLFDIKSDKLSFLGVRAARGFYYVLGVSNGVRDGWRIIT